MLLEGRAFGALWRAQPAAGLLQGRVQNGAPLVRTQRIERYGLRRVEHALDGEQSEAAPTEGGLPPASAGLSEPLEQQQTERLAVATVALSQLAQPVLDLLSVQGRVVDHDQRGALPAPAREVLLAAKARQLGAVREPGVPSVRLGKLAQMQREPRLAGPGAARSARARPPAFRSRATRAGNSSSSTRPMNGIARDFGSSSSIALRVLHLRRQVQLEMGVARNHGVAVAHDLNDGVVSADDIDLLAHVLSAADECSDHHSARCIARARTMADALDPRSRCGHRTMDLACLERDPNQWYGCPAGSMFRRKRLRY